jgi:hypothetical protein
MSYIPSLACCLFIITFYPSHLFSGLFKFSEGNLGPHFLKTKSNKIPPRTGRIKENIINHVLFGTRCFGREF